MKFYTAALVAFFPTAAFAHSGHVELVDGHTHTLAELAMMGAAPVVVAVAAFAVYWFVAQRNG